MRKFIPVAIVFFLVLVVQQRSHRANETQVNFSGQGGEEQVERADPPGGASGSSQFHCDGRTHCSQMTSCEEATWFLENCPGVKMDGEGDGVPCERQWCGHH
jgi:hypothetical protein